MESDRSLIAMSEIKKNLATEQKGDEGRREG